MIPDFFINLLNGFIDFLPSIGIDWGVYSLQPLFNALATLNYYVPVSETFYLISLVIGFYTFRFLYNIVKWLLERIVI